MRPDTSAMEEPPTVDWELADDGAKAGLFYEVAKRMIDVMVSASLLLLLAPFLLLVALCIRIDSPGPIFYSQRRTGRLGKRFVMFKFRTMGVGADRERGKMARLSKLQPPDFKIEDDPRITRIGRYLRQWSIDEIPNLFNVLRGDMSLVGPRPTTWGPELYEEWQLERLSVRPGVTGLWQVMGRGDVHFDDRVRLDMRYIRDRSLGLDMWILMRTVKAVLSRRGAY